MNFVYFSLLPVEVLILNEGETFTVGFTNEKLYKSSWTSCIGEELRIVIQRPIQHLFQVTTTCSNLKIETLKQGVKYVQSQQ